MTFRNVLYALVVMAIVGVVYQAVVAPAPDPAGIRIRSESERFP